MLSSAWRMTNAKSLQQLRSLLKAFCVAKVVRLFPDKENVASYTKNDF